MSLKFREHTVKDTILRQARKEGNIVYGGRAIKRRLGINARPTKDFDLFSKTPRKSAIKTEKSLDKEFRKNSFYTKKGFNISTWKVKHTGKDMKKGTKDDIGIADYTKTPSPTPKTFQFRNVNYRALSEELAAKKKLVGNNMFEFRRKKDLADLKKIKKFGGLK